MSTRQSILTKARDAGQRPIKERTWQDWVDIGQALALGRAEALQASGAIRPRGAGYNKIYSAWLKNEGFDRHHFTVRYYALKIIEILPELETWLKTLSPEERSQLVDPYAVFRAYDKARHHLAPPWVPPDPSPPPPSGDLEQVRELYVSAMAALKRKERAHEINAILRDLGVGIQDLIEEGKSRSFHLGMKSSPQKKREVECCA
jgi:hypothetical protein